MTDHPVLKEIKEALHNLSGDDETYALLAIFETIHDRAVGDLVCITTRGYLSRFWSGTYTLLEVRMVAPSTSKRTSLQKKTKG
ncbi:hypothetical protein LXM26_01395 [Dyadobacter sp. LJ419]|uniref:Uncharacterized protein n=1 Tax=Dyadobacter chenwenxiniae TaxID=2906456 RepID=A0A9X1TBR0_9BACT|nr:hypothetical protein [Dyadobacter chenwenxiniae]MCF0060131.1 hypothetical protein [Dyadobacter chenwenxiniae]